MKKEILWSMTAPQQSMTPYAQFAKAQHMSAKPSVAKFALIGFISNVSVSNRLISVLSGKMSHFSAPNANPDHPKRPNPKAPLSLNKSLVRGFEILETREKKSLDN